METETLACQRLKGSIVSLLKLELDSPEVKSRKCNGKESCSDDELFESAPNGIKIKNEKEELDLKNIDEKLDYDLMELAGKGLNYSYESPNKSEFIEQEELHIKDEEDKEDMLKNKKCYNSQRLSIQPETIQEMEVEFKRKVEEKKKLYKKAQKSEKQLVLYQCPECSYSTSSKFCFESHSIKHKKRDEIDWYKCPECPYKTPRKNNLKNHGEIHNSSMLKCSKCSYETLRSSSFKNHQMKHMTNIDWLYCPKCSFKSKIPSCLRCHVLSHKSYAFKCTKCSYQSRTKRQLTVHQVKHEPLDKWHLCSLCPYKTYIKARLEVHCQRRHN